MDKSIKKIAVFRALHLGDLVCSMPAIRLLKQSFPEASISLIGLEESSALVRRYYECLDKLIVFPGYPGLPEAKTDPISILNFINRIRAEKFDLIVQLHGNGSIVNQLLLFWGSKYLWTFYAAKEYSPLQFAKSALMDYDWPEITGIRYPEHLHEVHRHLSLIEHAIATFKTNTGSGKVTGDDQLFFPVFREDYIRYAELRLPLTTERFVIVHPGSRGVHRRWPIEHFAKVAEYCLDLGFQVVFTGTKGERGIIESLQALVEGNTLNLAGKTDLGTLGVLIDKAALVFSNCTGISHIAAALKKDAIIISMDGEPKRWGALDSLKIYTHDWLRKKELYPIFSALETKLGHVG